jgi:peptidoglycan/LPS O-acetylase OafA/YrhL
MSDPNLPAQSRIEGLDGLRAYLLTTVILFHLQIWNVGWLAMPVFFVMSGFLITRILLDDHILAPSRGAFFVRFYARRVVRIVPVYYVYIVLTALVGLVIGQFDAMKPYIGASLLFLMNFFSLTPAADLASPAGRFFMHGWSLAVEEQFYLLWPLLIAFVPRRRLKFALILLGLFAIVYRFVVVFGLPLLPKVPDNPLAPYAVLYMTPFNWFDSFALGAAMNFIRWAPKVWHVLLLIAVTLALGILNSGAGEVIINGNPRHLVLGYPFLLPLHKQAIWGYPLLALNSFVLLLAIVNGKHFLKPLRVPFAVWLGKRTYSGYLFHIPAIAVMFRARHVLDAWFGVPDGNSVLAGLVVFPFVFAITCVFAHFSYNWVEKPFFARRDRLIPRWAESPRAGAEPIKSVAASPLA